MSLNLRIGRIRGIDLYIHWTFWLLPVWIVFSHDGREMFPLWMHLLLIASLFGCVILHELGHALTAQRFGIGTRDITLTPLGGIAQLERMSTKPWEEFCIAIAGPLVNVAIAVLLGPLLLAWAMVWPGAWDSLAWQFGGMLWLLNVIMVVFNMIPAFPMDGGRVLRALLAASMDRLRATRIAVAVGTGFAILFGLAGMFVLANPWLLLIALFVILAGIRNWPRWSTRNAAVDLRKLMP
jgi:Zn-dependent protease